MSEISDSTILAATPTTPTGRLLSLIAFLLLDLRDEQRETNALLEEVANRAAAKPGIRNDKAP